MLCNFFNRMIENLKESAMSMDNLNEEIRERKKAEELLIESEERYRKLFEGALDAIFVADAETGILIDCNPAATRLLGMEKSEIVGKHQRTLHPPERIKGGYSETFKNHLGEKRDQTLETQIITKAGEIKDVAIKASLLEIRGKKVLQGIFRDITERKKAEEELKKLLSLHTATLEATADGILVVDLRGRVVSYNQQFLELWKIPASLAQTRDDEKLLSHVLDQLEDPKGFLAEVHMLYSHSEEQSLDLLGFKDGRVFERFSKPQKFDNRIIGRVWSFRDITERKKAEQRQANLLEELEKTNEELKEFAYIVSHDLKAPLRGIMTIIGFIADDYADKFDENSKRQVELLESRAERMCNLIDGVLRYSRIGKENEEKVRVDLNSLVPEIIDLIAPPEKISITIEDELPVIVCGRTRIAQVFQNLIGNAVKYMDKPEGVIKIGCLQDGDFLKFSVADNGPGIEEKQFDRIFKVFETLNRQDDIDSTGVGLTVAKKIINIYGGNIWVESEVGQGSTFFFTLPLHLRATEAAMTEIYAKA